MGLNGSAVASVITGIAMLAAYCAVLAWTGSCGATGCSGAGGEPEWTRLREMVGIGAPIALTILAEAGLFSGAGVLMGLIGPAQLAGHTIALQVAALAFQVPFGIGQAATIRVGYHYGARDRAGIGRAGWAAVVLSVAVHGPAGRTDAACAPSWCSASTSIPRRRRMATLVGFAVQFMVVAAAFQLFDRPAGGRRGGAARIAGHARADAFCAVRLLGAGPRHRVWLGFFTPLAGLGVWIGLAVGLGRRRAADGSSAGARRARLGCCRPDAHFVASGG
jgi:MATE family multidrug resistance protein